MDVLNNEFQLRIQILKVKKVAVYVKMFPRHLASIWIRFLMIAAIDMQKNKPIKMFYFSENIKKLNKNSKQTMTI